VEPSIAAIILGEMAFLGWVLRLVLGYIQERARRRAELQARVLDRFGSATEFIDFLATEPGRRFQDALSGRRGSQARLLIGAILVGTVLVFVGVGLLVAHLKIGRDPSLLVGGIVTLAVGLGFLVAAPVSYGIARRWGLLGPAGLGDPAEA
jgi:hypothetical protein